MLLFKLAYRNIRGAGLRSFLNILVMSIIFVLIVWMQGLYEGVTVQATTDMIREDVAGGHYRHPAYDPHDLVDLMEAHQSYQPQQKAVDRHDLEPVLIINASVYPNGRMQSALLKGIRPDQALLDFPAHELKPQTDGVIPALIGKRMADMMQVALGDEFIIQWRDRQGTFDAATVRIVHIMTTIVPTIDAGQIWIPLERLQEMTGMTDEATYLIARPGFQLQDPQDWEYYSQDELVHSIVNLMETKSSGGMFLYLILLLMAMLSIFDTQVLAIFKRRKEIGTLVALGMTQKEVSRLFTLEGTMFGLLGAALAVILGIPICLYTWRNGINFGPVMDSFNLAVSPIIYPIYTPEMIVTTFILVLFLVMVISRIPARKIASLRPTDAIAGRRIYKVRGAK
ncbi:MAG: ABC transporter permease [Fidelibacterota bacterium]